jgi:hypothetical protein
VPNRRPLLATNVPPPVQFAKSVIGDSISDSPNKLLKIFSTDVLVCFPNARSGQLQIVHIQKQAVRIAMPADYLAKNKNCARVPAA